MNQLASIPHYLTAGNKQIFTLYYPAEPAQESEAVILCPPGPQDMLRAHSALVQLARRMQAKGLQVMRFDYSHTGDSEGHGDSLSIDHWVHDLSAVYQWLKQQSPDARISLIGLRLGAAVAIRASQKLEIEQLVLWDPVVDGLDYLKALEKQQQLIFSARKLEPPYRDDWFYRRPQSLGIPFSPHLKEELAAISPATMLPQAKKVSAILGAADSKFRLALEDWAREGTQVELQVIGESLHWGLASHFKLRAQAALHIRRLLAIWEKTSHA